MNRSRILKAYCPVIIIIVLGLLIIGGVSATEFGPWSLQTVASAGDVGQYSSIALNAAGNPAISYYDQTNKDLNYASWDGSRWAITTVDRIGDVGKYSSLALDNSGKPRISYYDQTNGDLKYASWDGSRWVITTVDGTNYKKGSNWDGDHGRYKDKFITVGMYSSLALDSSGNPRISYYDQTNGDLKYASWDGSRWVITTVDGTDYKEGSNWDGDHGRYEDKSTNVGAYSSLALDSSGKPRISYYDQTNGDLKYASWDGSRWVITTIDGTNYKKGSNWDKDHGRYEDKFITVGMYSSLALDSSGNPRISYYDQTNGDLKYSSWDGSRWVISTADSIKDVGEYSSLELDVRSDPRISYYDATNANLKFAAWNRTTSQWVTETVDSSKRVGTYTSLALDSLGNPRISYYDQKNQDLKYAAGTGHMQNPTAPAPTFTSITPATGPAAGGTPVTIVGTNFVSGGSSGVTIGGVAATNVVVVDSAHITATIPAGTAGTQNVVITNNDGQTVTATGAYTYTAPAPTFTSISPSSGPAAGGQTVTITGTNFITGAGATTVTIGGTAATGVSVSTSTTLTATTPLGTAGSANVVVTTAGGSATGTGAYTYAAAPAVTGVSPSSGPLSGGSAVTISGTNLASATAVKFGTVTATIVADTAGLITVTPLTGTAGTVDITVTTSGGTSATSSADQYTYAAAPAVTGISLSSGPLSSGPAVTITGTNLASATAVNFGTTPATILTNSATSITVTPPAGQLEMLTLLSPHQVAHQRLHQPTNTRMYQPRP